MGHIFYATLNRIAKVEDDYREMMELKKRAEAADVAKSQVRDLSTSLHRLVYTLFHLCCGINQMLILQFLATVSHEIRTPMNGVLGKLKTSLLALSFYNIFIYI